MVIISIWCIHVWSFITHGAINTLSLLRRSGCRWCKFMIRCFFHFPVIISMVLSISSLWFKKFPLYLNLIRIDTIQSSCFYYIISYLKVLWSLLFRISQQPTSCDKHAPHGSNFLDIHGFVLAPIWYKCTVVLSL